MLKHVLAQIAQAVPVGEGARQPRGDLGAIDRLRHDPKIMVEHGQIEAREMKQLGDVGIGEQPPQPWRVVAAGGELHEMGVAVAARELHQAQPVAMRVEPHRLGVDRHRLAEFDALRQVAVMKPVTVIAAVMAPT